MSKQKLTLSAETIAILRNFSAINKAIFIKPGSVIRAVTASKSVAARAEVEENFEVEFGILELPKFLAALSLFNEPELTITENESIVIKEGSKKITYYCSPENTILTVEEQSFVKMNGFMDDVDNKFDLTYVDFQGVQKGLSVLKLSEYRIAADGKRVTMAAIDPDNNTADKYEVALADSSSTFEAFFRAENLNFLPFDYQVTYNPQGMARFQADKISYFISAEARK